MKEDEIDTAIGQLKRRQFAPWLLAPIFFLGSACGFWFGVVAVSESQHAQLNELRADLRRFQDVATDLDERLRERNKHIRVLLDARDEEAQRRQLREMFPPRRIELLPPINVQWFDTKDILVMPLVDQDQ